MARKRSLNDLYAFSSGKEKTRLSSKYQTKR